jgi:chaperonin cofactor prefoldin
MLQKIKLVVATIVSTIVGLFLFARFRKNPIIEEVFKRDKQIKDEVALIKKNIKEIDKDIKSVDSKIESIPDDENWHKR